MSVFKSGGFRVTVTTALKLLPQPSPPNKKLDTMSSVADKRAQLEAARALRKQQMEEAQREEERQLRELEEAEQREEEERRRAEEEERQRVEEERRRAEEERRRAEEEAARRAEETRRATEAQMVQDQSETGPEDPVVSWEARVAVARTESMRAQTEADLATSSSGKGKRREIGAVGGDCWNCRSRGEPCVRLG